MGNLKEFKIIDLIDNETNKVKYSSPEEQKIQDLRP